MNSFEVNTQIKQYVFISCKSGREAAKWLKLVIT